VELQFNFAIVGLDAKDFAPNPFQK